MAKPEFVSRFVCAKAEQRYCSIMTDHRSLKKRQAKMLGHRFPFMAMKTCVSSLLPSGLA